MPLPPNLRHLLARSSLPPSAHPGRKNMHLSAALATEVVRSIIMLQDPRDRGSPPYELQTAFLAVARRNPAVVGGALQRTLVDPSNPAHGCRLSFLVNALAGPLHSEEVSWTSVVNSAQQALHSGKWHPQDLRGVLRGISLAGVYPPTLPAAVEKYVADKLAFAENNELGAYAAILTSLPETRNSPLLRTLATRATAAVGVGGAAATGLSLAGLGGVCRSFLRAQFYNQQFVAKVAESIPTNVDSTQLPLQSAVAIFTLWSLAGFSADGKLRTMDDEIADKQKEIERERKEKQRLAAAAAGGLDPASAAAAAAAAAQQEGGADEALQEGGGGGGIPTALPSLIRIMVEELGENDDVELLVLLLRGVAALTPRHWAAGGVNFNRQLDDLLSAVSSQCQAFLAETPAAASSPSSTSTFMVTIDQLSAMLPRYFVALKRRPRRLAPNPELDAGVEAFCTHIDKRVEDIIGSSDAPPFFIVPHLLDHGALCCRKTVVRLLMEAKAQDAALPTLQTMRFLLECADSKTFTAPVARYLRKNFSLAQEGVPLVQLTSAMMCFAVAERLHPMEKYYGASQHQQRRNSQSQSGENNDNDDDDNNNNMTSLEEVLEERVIFIDDVLTALERATNYRWDLRCLMKLASSLGAIGLNAEQRGRMTLLLSKKMGALVESADPRRYSKPDAVGCLEAFMMTQPQQPTAEGADSDSSATDTASNTTTAAASSSSSSSVASVVPESVSKFLASCSLTGEDDSVISPSRWMVINDPATTIVERTLEQQKVDMVLAKLRLIPIEDEASIHRLVNEDYIKMFRHIHPDEVRFIFEIFADRTIKQDKLLRDVMALFIASGSVQRVSIFTVASILNSCAQLRFAYIPMVKQMLAAISDEQWSLIDAVELELLLVALQRLGIRVASILMTLGEKALQLCGALTASQAASLIAAFQQLGFYEDVVMSALLQRTAECADSMSAVTLSVLLGGPQAHRLPLNEKTAMPIVRRLTKLAGELAPHQRTRIATTLKKTSLPLEMLAAATGKLAQLTADSISHVNAPAASKKQPRAMPKHEQLKE